MGCPFVLVHAYIRIRANVHSHQQHEFLLHNVCMFIFMYIFVYLHMYMCIYIFVYTRIESSMHEA